MNPKIVYSIHIAYSTRTFAIIVLLACIFGLIAVILDISFNGASFQKQKYVISSMCAAIVICFLMTTMIPSPSDMIAMEAIRLHEQDNSKSTDEYTDQLYEIMPQYKYENKK